jgi:hypothetical protein
MPKPSEWIPIEWPSSWQDPALFKLIEAGPINCILLPANAPPALRAAAERRWACPSELKWRKASEIDWRSPGEVVAISDGVWPGLARSSGGGGGGLDAGPTGAPWLDANGWLIQMARSRAPGKPVWIRSEPPENTANLSANSFRLALSEAAAYGARRPIWLPAELAAEIAAGKIAAVTTWERILADARWHLERSRIAAWEPFARLLVISDFSGPNEYNGTEVLNLSVRRNLSFRIAEPGQFTSQDLQGMRAVLYVDAQPQPAPLAAALQKFVEDGGLLLSMQAPAKALKNLRPSRETYPRFDIFQCGKGRVAISKAEYEDPYILAQDAHILMSRRHDAVRLFNAGSLTTYHSASPDRKRWLVQLLNYARYGAAHQVSLQTWEKVSAAWFVSLETPAAPLEIHRETGCSEVYLPRFSVYGAVELELTSHA